MVMLTVRGPRLDRAEPRPLAAPGVASEEIVWGGGGDRTLPLAAPAGDSTEVLVEPSGLKAPTLDTPGVRRPGAASSSWVAWSIIAGVFLLVVAGRLLGLADAAALQTFTIVASSIVIEALPFVMLGAVVSGIIEVYVSDTTFLRLASLPVALQIPAAALGGVALPVCECGSVPIARRVIARGLHPAAGIAFMLAAPVVNPVVLLSTWVAYQGRDIVVPMVAGRAALGLVLAIAVGVGDRWRPQTGNGPFAGNGHLLFVL